MDDRHREKETKINRKTQEKGIEGESLTLKPLLLAHWVRKVVVMEIDAHEIDDIHGQALGWW